MQTVREMEVILQNKLDPFSRMVDLLDADNIKIIALYFSSESDQGKLHFVAHDPDKARNILNTAGYQFKINDVIACELPKHPTALNAILKPIKTAGIHVQYLYPCLTVGPTSALVLSTNQLEKTLDLLRENWIRVFGDEVYHL